MECIILAGGLGTRLKDTIGAYPKCMAPINDKPFVQYLFDYLEVQQCTRVILSLGYQHEIVLEWLSTQKRSFSIDHVIEQEPLGTGGAIQLAMQKAKTQNVLVLNGDTLFQVSLKQLLDFHTTNNADTTLALKEMKNFDRYGTVILDDKRCITSFEEKKESDYGLINGGVYVINKKAFLNKSLPEKFSFEKDYLEAYVNEGKFYGYKRYAYFIDIGVPEDYEQAKQDFKKLFK